MKKFSLRLGHKGRGKRQRSPFQEDFLFLTLYLKPCALNLFVQKKYFPWVKDRMGIEEFFDLFHEG